jgi:hypothetical protein
MNKLIGLIIATPLGIVIAAHAPLPAGQTFGSQLPPREISPADRVSPWVGRWNVEFANGIHEVHELRQDYTVTVRNIAQNWSCQGRIEFDDMKVTIAYDNDRLERWTPVGDRMVVEHWHPASQLPIKPPLLGIANREE